LTDERAQRMKMIPEEISLRILQIAIAGEIRRQEVALRRLNLKTG